MKKTLSYLLVLMIMSLICFDNAFAAILNNGLGTFSRYPFISTFADKRIAWCDCCNDADMHFDCLAKKGFTVSRIRIPLNRPMSSTPAEYS